MVGRCPAIVACLVLSLLVKIETAAAQVMVQPSPAEITVINATNVFAQAMVMPGNSIPRNLIAQAQGIAIVPGMVRGAFVVGVQHGRGVLVTRDAQGTWQAPRMIQITGGSIGAQIGGQAIDIVLVIMDRRGLENLLANQFKVGADGSVAAGPVGRTAEAATDIQMRAQILSYSRARGLFAGVSLNGSSIRGDEDANKAFYGEPLTIRAIVLENKAKVSSHADAAAAWQKALAQYTKGK